MGISETQDLATRTEVRGARLGDERLPRVSVVVPVLNAAAEIDRLLHSLEALDYPADRLQIVVVDNGSTDGTPAAVTRHPGVHFYLEHRVRSSYAARNRGIRAARGSWVAFTDSDCVATPDWLRRLLSPPIPDEVGAVAGEIEALEDRTPVQRLTERFGIMRHAVTLPHKGLPCFSTANVAIRRDLLELLGGFRDDVRFFGDMELSWRMQIAAGVSILFRPEAVVRHRHRRTLGELWRQGSQHGRGVAFMKRTFPDRYRIDPREQLRRLGSIVHSAGRAALPGIGSGDADRDRWFTPFFLAVWYGGMGAGYLLGPARSTGRGGRRKQP
jgi:cellulose synthase/poly-beta-1,6-N-acetylglucosamine synthase-like glycosyltransferase